MPRETPVPSPSRNPRPSGNDDDAFFVSEGASLPVTRVRSYAAAVRRRVFLGALSVAVVGLTTVGLAGSALAQEKAHKKITLEDLVIEGNIQKPEAFFILPRTNLNFADLERREDLKSRIIKSVEKEPF